MRNKIYAFIITVTLFLSMNGITKAAEKENLKVGTIQFSQLKEIPEEFLREKIPVKEGDVYSNKSLSEIYLALKRLNYISNVNVYPQQEGDTVNLVVEVDETANALEAAQRAETAQDLTKKTEFVVSKVDVKGLEKISKEEALKNVKVKEGDQFIPQEAIDGAQKIFQTGLFASVEPSVEREANNTVAITYIVEENPIVKDIEISGNTLFTEAQLEQALGIKEGELLNGNLLNPDNNGIIKLYNKGGYTTARIETINVSKEGDIKIGLTEGMVDSVVFKKESAIMMATNGGGLLYVDLLLLFVAVIGVFISLFSKWNLLGSVITVISFATYSFLHPYWNFFVIILFVFGFLFLGFEVLISGIGALGVLGTVFVLGGMYWANQAVMDLVVLMLMSLLLAIALLVLLVKRGNHFSHKKGLVLLSSLKKSKGYSTSKVYDDLVKKTGKTLTVLRPSGKAELNGEIVDVVSTGFVIPEDTMIQVVKVEGSKIVVQVLENNNE